MTKGNGKVDWKIVITIVSIIINVLIFAVIKFNDLSHLKSEVEKVGDKLDKIEGRQFDFNHRLSKVEGRIR